MEMFDHLAMAALLVGLYAGLTMVHGGLTR